MWALAAISFLVWQVAVDADAHRFGAILGVGILVPFGLILASAVIDRLETRKTDPFRKVKKCRSFTLKQAGWKLLDSGDKRCGKIQIGRRTYKFI